LKLYLISFEILVSNPGSSLGQERASGVEIWKCICGCAPTWRSRRKRNQMKRFKLVLNLWPNGNDHTTKKFAMLLLILETGWTTRILDFEWTSDSQKWPSESELHTLSIECSCRNVLTANISRCRAKNRS
jgi:hypothetical protein